MFMFQYKQEPSFFSSQLNGSALLMESFNDVQVREMQAN